MAIRYYVLPIEHNNNARGPKYFTWRYDPDPPGINCPWSMKDYGLMDQAVLCADIQPADATTMAGYADVLSIPANLDTNLTAGAVNTAKNYLESVNIPAGWISTADTYRSVLRSLLGIFFFLQRVTAIAGQAIDWVSVPLNTQWRNIPATWRDAMTQAATEMQFDTSGTTNNTTLRAILKNMADQWTTPILFGLDTL
jgi:hypothetical protein